MKSRKLTLDIFNYKGEHVCNLYDNNSDMSGQATDVVVTSERNGWKELSFHIPSTCMGENGEERNYRLDYLISEYRIRLIDDYEPDWFIISENKVTHNAFSNDVDVRAGHISMLLKTKNLSLEFSDDEGNNVGTAKQLLTTILEGTDWGVGYVYNFVEEDKVYDEEEEKWVNPTKIRSLVASSKSGCFKLIQDMCELFDAKPIYHGVNKRVDIIPMNPFSENLAAGQIPEEVINGNRKVIELHYDRNIKGITRTLDSENMITKLYAYGSYGDMNGLCSMQTCKHDEYTFHASGSANKEFQFREKDNTIRYFTIDETISASDDLIYSRLDFASRSYVWNDRTKRAYHVYTEPKGSFTELGTVTPIEVQNYFPAIFDFDYYYEVGLLTEEMFQAIASYQRNAYASYVEAEETAITLVNELSSLSQLANSQTGVLRLAVTDYTIETDKSVTLDIDTSQGDHGVLWRTDYAAAEKNYFSWCPTYGLKANGDPLTTPASLVMILHPNTNPMKWEKLYLKQIDDRQRDAVDSEGNPCKKADNYIYKYSEGYPEKVTLFGKLEEDEGNIPAFDGSEVFYLFASNSTSGSLGAMQMQAESILNQEITTSTATTTEKHPFYFRDGSVSRASDGKAIHVAPVPALGKAGIENGYGWYYTYYPYDKKYDESKVGQTYNEQYQSYCNIGDLYFCDRQDETWHRVWIANTTPADNTVANGDYFFNEETRRLYRKLQGNGNWYLFDTTDEKRIASTFSEVYYYCRRWDQIIKGEYEKYVYTHRRQTALPLGRYLFDTGYDYFWAFTITQTIPFNSKLILDTTKKRVYQDNDVGHIVSATVTPKYTIKRQEGSLISADKFISAVYDKETGAEISGVTGCSSPLVTVAPGITYVLENYTNGYIIFYDGANRYRSYINITSSNFVVPPQTTEDYDADNYKPAAQYLRVVLTQAFPPTNISLKVTNDGFTYFMEDNAELPYVLLKDNFTADETSTLKGLNHLTQKFYESIEHIYGVNVTAPVGEPGTVMRLTDAQENIKQEEATLAEALGDILREGYWQENSYVKGEESKLYRDAMDNLEKMAKPNATYDIDFLDLYGEQQIGLTVDENVEEPSWFETQVTDAAHLVDPEIAVNCWAYFDKTSVCYDQPWRTSIEINTNLSLIGQHSFTDVMTKIAEVAKESNAKQSLYDHAVSQGTPPPDFDIDSLVAELGSLSDYVYEKLEHIPNEWKPVDVPRDTVDTSYIIPTSDANLPSSAALAAETVRGVLDMQNVMLNSGKSSWFTDETGAIIFLGDNWIMRLSGAGLGIASSRDPKTNDWVFQTAITGAGISASCITSGFLATERILTGSITVDKLEAAAGQVLDISSNNALLLYATVDGSRPAGGVLTTDSCISIATAFNVEDLPEWEAGKEYLPGMRVKRTDSSTNPPTIKGYICKIQNADTSFTASHWEETQNLPARIGILSGGEILLRAAAITQEYADFAHFPATGETGIEYKDMDTGNRYIWDAKTNTYVPAEGGKINIEATSEININSDGKINIMSGGDLLVGSEGNLKVLSEGTLEILANGNLEVGSGAGMKVDAQGELKLLAGAHMYLQGGGTLNIGAEDADITHWPLYVTGTRYQRGACVRRTVSGQIVGYVCKVDESSATWVASEWEETDGTAKLNINSHGAINIDAGGKLHVGSQGEMDIHSGGKLVIQSDSTFEVHSDNFAIDENGSVTMTGVVKAFGGTIGGWRIYGTPALHAIGSSVPAGQVVGPIQGDYDTTRYDGWLYYDKNSSGAYDINDDLIFTGGGIRNGSTVQTSTVGIGYGTASNTICFWAGNNDQDVGTSAFRVQNDGTVYANNLIITGGKIGSTAAGQFTIFTSDTKSYFAKGKNSPESTADGVYLGTDGIAVGDNNKNFRIYKENNVWKIEAPADDFTIGNVSIATTIQNIADDAQAAEQAAADAAAAAASNAHVFYCPATGNGNITEQDYHVNDIWICTSTDSTYQAGWEYICIKDDSNPKSIVTDWVLTGASSITGAALSVNAQNGTIRLTAANAINIASGGTVSIGGSEQVTIATANGSVKIGKSTNLFTFSGKTVDNAEVSYMSAGGKTAYNSSADGVYIGTDGIGLGQAKFYVTSSGSLTATDATIANWTVKSDYIGNANTKAGSTVGLSAGTGDDVCFWAGNTANNIATAKFRVEADGDVYANSLTLAGGSVGSGIDGTIFKVKTDGTNSALYCGKQAYSDATSGVYLGTDGIGIGSGTSTAAFYVTANGSAYFAGNINATGGYIGGWDIGNDSIHAGSGTEYTALSIGSCRFWTGAANDANAKFAIYKGGEVKISKGTFAGWTVDNGTMSVGSSQGSTPTYTAISTSGDYRLWAGDGTSSSAPFYLKSDGTIHAEKGTIAGWYFDSNDIRNADTSANSSMRFHSGANSYISAGTFNSTYSTSPFYVNASGTLEAIGATLYDSTLSTVTFTGTINNVILDIGASSNNINRIVIKQPLAEGHHESEQYQTHTVLRANNANGGVVFCSGWNTSADANIAIMGDGTVSLKRIKLRTIGITVNQITGEITQTGSDDDTYLITKVHKSGSNVNYIEMVSSNDMNTYRLTIPTSLGITFDQVT